jgi:hypothetical protein
MMLRFFFSSTTTPFLSSLESAALSAGPPPLPAAAADGTARDADGCLFLALVASKSCSLDGPWSEVNNEMKLSVGAKCHGVHQMMRAYAGPGGSVKVMSKPSAPCLALVRHTQHPLVTMPCLAKMQNTNQNLTKL